MMLDQLDVSMQLEINNLAVHAGLSVQQKLFQIDSVLPQTMPSMLSYHQKIWSSVTNQIWLAMVDG
jgi:hypothetical protein